jgi:threonine dehydrogenase-like Zn-dependent dehydrogenase
MTRSRTSITAVLCHGPEDHRLEGLNCPAPGARQVVLRTDASGTCASDYNCWSRAKMFRSGNGAWPWVKA